MKFSVLMSIYHKEQAEFLKQSLDSVINNTLQPDEIVIVKDGKLTDELDTILEEYANNYSFIKLCGYEENKGLGEALRFGVEHCSYNIIARMDTDDICDKFRFEKQIKYLEEHPECNIIGSNVLEFIDNIENGVGQRNMPESHEEIIKFSKSRNPLVHPTMVMKKELILEAGNYRHYHLVEDYDLLVRMIMKGGNCYNVQENLVYVRVGVDFYNRRGGWKYCKSIAKFEKELYKKKYISFFKFITNVCIRSAVYLSPSWLRGWIYKKKLRKYVKNKGN